jgi:dihydroorotate dehydrogenase electron transfer subunit
MEIIKGHYLLRVQALDIAAIAQPGQFVMVKCGEKLTLRRPISIHRVTKSGEIHLFYTGASLLREVYKVDREVEPKLGKGEGTLWLSQRCTGERLDLLGPLGNGFNIDTMAKNFLLIAGGIGIAPLVFLAEHALDDGKSVKLLLGARTSGGIYPQELLPNGFEIPIVTEDGSLGKKGMVSKYVMDYFDWADQVYACGPIAMYQAIAEKVAENQITKPIQISLEVRMGCGIGACYSCSIKTTKRMKRVCMDGPVFNLDETILEEVCL